MKSNILKHICIHIFVYIFVYITIRNYQACMHTLVHIISFGLVRVDHVARTVARLVPMICFSGATSWVA